MITTNKKKARSIARKIICEAQQGATIHTIHSPEEGRKIEERLSKIIEDVLDFYERAEENLRNGEEVGIGV